MRAKCRQPGPSSSGDGHASNVTKKGDVLQEIQQDMLDKLTELLRETVHHHGMPLQRGTPCATTLTVTKAWHVENWPLWQDYVGCRRGLVERLEQQKPDAIDPPLEGDLQSLVEDCDKNINEVLLFHGTKHTAVDDIVTTGFDDRLSGQRSIYGQGSYFASQICKSLQYVDPGDKAMIFVSRVLVGNPWFAREVDPTMRLPPTKNGRVCDSVIARPGHIRNHPSLNGIQCHQEFVIFERCQAYPEYLLEVDLS